MEAPFDWLIFLRLLPIRAPLGSSSINISKATCLFSVEVYTIQRCHRASLHSHGFVIFVNKLTQEPSSIPARCSSESTLSHLVATAAEAVSVVESGELVSKPQSYTSVRWY